MADDAPFAFDYFDDDVFVTKAERIIPEQAPYTAKEETDGWFHSFNDYESLMHERHGPNQLKSAVEHDYLHKRYERALTGALKYIELVDSGHCKVSSTREMTEVAAHCALRLNRLDIAEQMVDRPQSTTDTGMMLIQARVYGLCKRHGDALSILVQYHKLRHHDYHAWHLVAMAVYDEKQANSMQNHLAQAAIQHAIRLMTNGCWQLQIEHVRRRYEKELEQLETLAREIGAQQGSADVFFAWMQQRRGQAELSAAGLGDMLAADVQYVYETCAQQAGQQTQQQEEEEEEEETRNVREL